MILKETIVSKGSILEADRTKLPNGVLCRGVWPICNIGGVNHNQRVYEKAVWEGVLKDEDIVNKMKTRTLYGHAEHPEKTQSDLQLTSHVVTDLFFDTIQENGKTVEKAFQKVDILDTPGGRIINTLIEAGCQVGVSTRAEGDLEEKEDDEGTKFFRVVPESYHYVTTDFTADPSTFNMAPVRVEKRLKQEIAAEGIKPEEKQFATTLIEGMKSKKVKEEKPSNEVKLFNWEMAKLGLGVRLKEGKYKTDKKGVEVEIKEKREGKITAIKESQITITTDSGEIITVDNPERLELIKEPEPVEPVEPPSPEPEPEEPGEEEVEGEPEAVPEEEEMGEKKKVEETRWDRKVKSFSEDEKFQELLAKYGEDSDEVYAYVEQQIPDEAIPTTVKSIIKAVTKEVGDGEMGEKVKEGKKPINENYNDLVDMLTKRFSKTKPQEAQHFVDGLRHKLLHEKITPTTTAKEIRRLRIAEASSKAERDEALNQLDEIERKLASITLGRNTEVRILTKKISEGRGSKAEAIAVCKVLEEKQNKLNEARESIKEFKTTIDDLGERWKKKMVRNEGIAKRRYERKLVEEYVKLKLEQAGLSVHKNTRALLERCTTVEDVDSVFEEVKEAVRQGALRPGKINEVQVKTVTSDGPGVAPALRSAVRGLLDGMR